MRRSAIEKLAEVPTLTHDPEKWQRFSEKIMRHEMTEE